MESAKSILFLLVIFTNAVLAIQAQHPRQTGKVQPTVFGQNSTKILNLAEMFDLTETQEREFRRKIKENCYDRLLLLVCSELCYISLPSDSRNDIFRILKNYNRTRRIPLVVPDPLYPIPNFRNDCVKIESGADAFIAYIVAQRLFLYEFSKSNPSPKKNIVQNVTNWLKNFELASDSVISVNATDLDEILEEQTQNGPKNKTVTALLLYSNRCPFRPQAAERTTRNWWAKIAESFADRTDRLAFLLMNVDSDRLIKNGTKSKVGSENKGWNKIFVQVRLNKGDHLNSPPKEEIDYPPQEIDLDIACPRLVLIKGGYFIDFHTHVKNVTNLYENVSIPEIRKFIIGMENRHDPATKWTKLEDRLTEIEYIYDVLTSRANANLVNRNFIAIGTTAGIGVIVLAISIFWGLKSSSYTGVTQTAILALADANPSLILATKNMKRHSSL